jgi:hypothetical protein
LKPFDTEPYPTDKTCGRATKRWPVMKEISQLNVTEQLGPFIQIDNNQSIQSEQLKKQVLQNYISKMISSNTYMYE